MEYKYTAEELMNAIGATAEMVAHFYKTCLHNGITEEAVLALTMAYLDNLMCSEPDDEIYE